MSRKHSFLNKSVMFVLIMTMLVALGAFSVVILEPKNVTVYAAENTHWLYDGNGLQPRDNSLINSSQFYAFDVTKGSALVGTTIGGITVSSDATSLVSNIGLKTEDTYSGIYYAINDVNMDVKMTLNLSASSGNSTGSFSVSLTYYSDASTLKSQETANYTIQRDAATQVSLALDNDDMGELAQTGGYVRVEISNATNGITFNNIRINVEVNMPNLRIGNTQVLILGENKLNQQVRAASDIGDLHVKRGDVILLNNSAYLFDEKYVFPHYYSTVFGLNARDNTIQWKDYINNESASDTYLKRFIDSSGSYAITEQEKSYFAGTTNPGTEFAKFTVLPIGSNATELRIRPKIHTITNANGTGSSNTAIETPVVFKIDDIAPPSPQLAEGSNMLNAIINNLWVTDEKWISKDGANNRLPLATFTHSINSYERVYAIAFTKDNPKDTDELRNWTMIYSQNVEGTSLYPFSFDGNGEKYTLALMAIDEAGNKSIIKKYSEDTYNPVKVDLGTHQLDATYYFGSEPYTYHRTNSDASSRLARDMANVGFLVGSNYHDAQGKVLDAYKYENWNLTTQQNVALFNVKRDQWVTIRLTISPSQEAKFRLTNFTNGGIIDVNNVVWKTAANKNDKYIDITFQMSDESGIPGNSNASTFRFNFKKRLTLKAKQTEITFTGQNISLENYMEAIDPVTNNVVNTNIGFSLKYKHSESSPDSDYNSENGTPRRGFIEAGEYYYSASITGEWYEGEIKGSWSVLKASPMVQGLRAKSELIYGMQDTVQNLYGMDFLQFDSIGSMGGRSDTESSLGVKGRFFVVSPSKELGEFAKDGYSNPNVNPARAITVRFVPEEPNDTNFYKNSKNYDVQEIEIIIKISPATVVLTIDENGYDNTYTGNQFPLQVQAQFNGNTVADVPFKIEYKLENASNDTYTTSAPYNAGRYKVRISILEKFNGAYVNYTCGTQELSRVLEIKKKELQIDVDQMGTSFVYGKFAANNIEALDGINIIGVGYVYSAKKNIDGVYVPIKIAGNDEVQYIMPYGLGVGEYLLKIKISHDNYLGEKEKTVIITMASQNNTQYAVSRPQLKDVPTLGGAHIEYGQKLQDIQFGDSYYGATYVFLGDSEPTPIDGIFFFRDITPNFGNITEVLTFRATGIHAGNIADTDFSVNVKIAQGKLNFDNVKFSDLTYEQKLRESSIIGEVMSTHAGVALGTYTIQMSLDLVLSAGTQQVPVEFVPANANFESVNTLLSISIDKKKLIAELNANDSYDNLDAISRIYGTQYTAPTFSLTTVDGNLDRSGVCSVGVDYYLNLANYNNNLSFAMGQSTFVGNYIGAVRSLNSNYIIESNISTDKEGQATFYYLVEKADLRTNLLPTTPTLRYRIKLQEIQFSTGSCSHINGQYSVNGKFEFVYNEWVNGDTIPTVGANVYSLRFLPDKEEDINNYNELIFDYTINVEKYVVTEFYFKNLTVTYNTMTQRPEVISYDPDGYQLNVEFLFNLTPGFLPIDAGDYKVKVNINSDLYEGTAERDFKIAKASATIDKAEQNFDYTGNQIFVNVSTSPLSSLGYTVIYKTHNGYNVDKIGNSNAPIKVGKYFANVTIDNKNYEGGEVIPFNVLPINLSLTNLSQVYRDPKTVELISLPMDLSYTIYYQSKNGGIFSQEMPKEAGKYNIKIFFNENGFLREYVSYNSVPFELDIAKAVATIKGKELYEVAYTASEHPLNIEVSPIGVGVKFSYRPNGSAEPYSNIAPILAGSYDVNIMIDDANYSGVFNTKLIIKKAVLKSINLPIANNAIYFTNSSNSVSFVGGEVRFMAKNQSVKGTYHITDEISTYFVGSHNVRLAFTPDDSQNYEVINDLTINIYIEKLNIGQYIYFKEDELTRRYNTLNQEVRAYISDKLALPSGYILKMKVLYNNSINPPMDVNDKGYNVVASIDDINYTGTSSTVTLKITQAELKFRLPTLTDIQKGQSLADSNIIGGEAYIQVGSRDISVSGKFSFEDSTTVYNTTNNNSNFAIVNFSPDNITNFKYTNLNVPILVIGIRLNEENIDMKHTSIKYGEKLEQSTLSIVATHNGKNITGTPEWIDGSSVPNVGDTARYRFVPSEEFVNDYNIFYGVTKIDVIKADMEVSNIEAIVFIGTTLRETIISADILHSLLGIAIGDAEIIIIEDQNLDDIVTNEMIGLTCRFVINQKNYNQSKEYSINITPYYNKGENIDVQYSQFVYENQDITIDRLGASLIGTEINVTGYNFRSILLDGKQVSQIKDAGTYVVVIEIITNKENALYKGYKEFTIKVGKKDISNEIQLNSDDTFVYGEKINHIVTSTTELSPQSYIILYYNEGMTDNYGTLVPQNAGSYKAKVVILSTEKNYSGERVFDFQIGKKVVTIDLPNVTTTYGVSQSVTPIISNNLSSKDYTLSYSGSAIMPTNEGTYEIRIVVTHNNFKGEATSRLIIQKGNLILDQKPTLSKLTYTQELSNSKISGGKVVFGSAAENISGRYEFESPSTKDLNVGYRTVAMKFIPTNSNYNVLVFENTIEITKAKASIIFGVVQVVYNGKKQTPTISISPSIENARVEFNFTQDGIIVDAIGAGSYQVSAKLLHDNYEAEANAIFTIMKAKAIENKVVKPTAFNITYGKKVSAGSLSDGQVYYLEGAPAAVGQFEYVDPGADPGDAGKIYTAECKFVPSDANNYEPYYCTVDVLVGKAKAEIQIKDNIIEYGSNVQAPTIKTNPINLTVDNSDFIANSSKVKAVGTYLFTATITDTNHEGNIVYSIIVKKKALDITFVNNNLPVDRYRTEYKKAIYADCLINQNSLVSGDRVEEIRDYIKFQYCDRNIENPSMSILPPTLIGEYKVVASMDHSNYELRENASINYDIIRANIESVEFDNYSLSSQIYGEKTTVPYVIVRPVGVSTKVSFPGYEYMPTAVGSYQIKVKITDENYNPYEKTSIFVINPLEITIENIVVTNKVFDGVATIRISGELKGIMSNDEVSLSMTAKTKNSSIEVGIHEVDITSWELSGRHASNYRVLVPLFNGTVVIKQKIVQDSNTSSYVSSDNGLGSGISLSVKEVYDKYNNSNMLTKVLGQESVVISFAVKEYNLEATLNSTAKFYIKIPEHLKNIKSLEVIALNNLENKGIKFEREGDYITFYADCSGEIMLVSNDFPNWIILLIASIIIMIIGGIYVFVLNPVKKRKKIPLAVRKEYVQIQETLIKKKEETMRGGKSKRKWYMD